MKRKIRMGSIWAFDGKAYSDPGKCIFAQVAPSKFVMIIIEGGGRGNRWREAQELSVIDHLNAEIEDEQWRELIGDHYNFVQVEE